MRTVMITTALSDNYGAALQTYALSQSIENLGHSSEVYNYNDPKRISASMTFKQKIIHTVWRFFVVLFTFDAKRNRYKKFRKKYLPLTGKKISSPSELKKNCGDYDVYIAGSDQIWNPGFFIHDTSYFLDFVPANRKKISYSSSFGKADFGKSKYYDRCCKALSEFDSISVREKSGINIVKNMCSKDAEWVLDPTLLLNKEEWKKVTSDKADKGKYILCYVMPGDKNVTDAIEKLAVILQKKTGYNIIRLGTKEYEVLKYGKNGCDIKAGPDDFVNYFMNAEYVITNSFHGTAFSINFGKKLFIPINGSLQANEALHERIISLLKLVNAENAVVQTDRITDDYDFSQNELDYDVIQNKLQQERVSSISYLEKAIGADK